MEQELKRNDFFLNTIYRKYVAASVLAMLATSVAGMIDTILVGWFLGETGLAAMSLVSPVYLFYYTVGAVIGMGGSISANIYIGKGDYDTYRRIFSLAFWITVFVCVLTTAAGLLLLEEIVSFLGGGRITEHYTREYLRWYIIGGSGTLLIYIPLNFLKIEGKPQISSFLFFLSSGMNVLFTWLFLSPLFHMGIKGASIGTALSMTVTALIGLYILLKKTRNTRLTKVQFSGRLVREILLCGSPNGCNNLMNAMKIMVINQQILYIGAGTYLSVFSMVRNVSDLITGVIIGAASALMPIVGVYYGEKDPGSIRRICKKALKVGCLLTVIPALLIAVFPDQICHLFHITDVQSRTGGQTALMYLAISFLFAFFNLMLSGYFNTIGRAMLSNLILCLRLFLYLAPAVMILGGWMGIDGIWMALVAADGLTFFTILFVMALIRRRSAGLDRYLLDTSEEEKEEISFSVRNALEDVMFASQKITEFCEASGIGIKKSMQVSLALEEMLTIIITYCMDAANEQFIDIRIKKLEEDVLLRIRNTGNIFDPIRYYEENRENPDMAEQLLGIRMITGTAKHIEFRETFGTNNLLIRF